MNFLKRTGSRIWPLWPFVRRVLSNSNHIRGCAAVLYVRTSTTSRCYEVCYSAAAGTYKMDAGSKAKRLRRCGRVICRNWPTISNSHHLRAKLFFDCCGMPSQTTAIETFCCLPQNEAFKCAKGKFLDNVRIDDLKRIAFYCIVVVFLIEDIGKSIFENLLFNISPMKNTKYERIDCTLLFLDRP